MAQINNYEYLKKNCCSMCVFFIHAAPCFLMCILFHFSFIWHVYMRLLLISWSIMIAGVPSSQALLGFLITASPSVCVPDVIGVLAVWTQNQKRKKIAAWLAYNRHLCHGAYCCTRNPAHMPILFLHLHLHFSNSCECVVKFVHAFPSSSTFLHNYRHIHYFLCLIKNTLCTSTVFKSLDGPWPHLN